MMKAIYILALFVSSIAFAQDSTRFEINGVWKFQLLYPVPFGDNALAKAYDNDLGFGIELGLFKYSNFRLGGGYNIVQYKVANRQLIGNIRNANYTSVYGNVSYEHRLSEKISVIPDIGYGFAQLVQRSSSQSFGKQDGNELRIGLNGNYNFTKFSSVFIGLHFIHTSLDINTSPEYEKFFGKMNQVQFAVGLAFD